MWVRKLLIGGLDLMTGIIISGSYEIHHWL